MAALRLIFLLLHIVTGAAWFGLALRLGGQARQVGRLDGEAAAALAEDGARAVRLMGLFLLLTFAFAMGLLGVGGGYPGQMQYHIASVFLGILIAVHYLMIRPAWRGLRTASAADAETHSYQKRLAAAVGCGHLLWLAILVLMFWNQFAAVW